MSASLNVRALLAAESAPPIFPRIDLRTGLLAAGALGACATLSEFSRDLRRARVAWRAAGFNAPFSAALSPELMRCDPEWIADAVREAGLSPRALTFELEETVVVRDGPEFAERLRAQGWGVALACDAACPLPFGKHARALYTEIILDAPAPLDPYLATHSCERSALGRRIYAAREAGLVVTARDVHSDSQAALLALAGFDRAGGPVAAQP